MTIAVVNDEFNYSVAVGDLAATTVCKEGYCKDNDPLMVKAMLYMFGLDTNKYYHLSQLVDEQGVAIAYRSPITDLVQTGGDIYVGHERTDDNWVKYGKVNLAKYLFTSDPTFINLIKEKNKNV